MSGDRPFAVYDAGGLRIDEASYCTYPGSARAEKAINAAVAARERKSAAKALREAADVAWCETCTDDMRIKEWLRTRADQVEKGEA